MSTESRVKYVGPNRRPTDAPSVRQRKERMRDPLNVSAQIVNRACTEWLHKRGLLGSFRKEIMADFGERAQKVRRERKMLREEFGPEPTR